MQFKDIINQKRIVSQFLSSVKQDRVSHNIMLTGPEGSGKLPLAAAFAQFLQCESPIDGDSCGTCKSCKRCSEMLHPDIHYIFPVIKKGSGKKWTSSEFISEFRELFKENPYFTYIDWVNKLGAENKQAGIFVDENDNLMKNLNLKSFMGKYKIFIIYMMEKVNTETANKILKALEEPPPQTQFILIADRTELILPTIISRSQQLKTSRLSPEDISEALQLYHQLPKEQADKLAVYADGSYNRAVSLINNQDALDENLRLIQDIMRSSYSFNIVDMSRISNNMKKMSRDNLKEFLEYLLFFIRNNMMLNAELAQMAQFSDSELAFAEKFSKFINPGSAKHLRREIEKAIEHIGRNVSVRIVLFDLFIRIYEILRKNATISK